MQLETLLMSNSKNYVKEIVDRLPLKQLHLSTAVHSLTTVDSSSSQRPQVLLQTIHGDTEMYDHVILACHSDTALSILKAGGRPSGTGGVTPDESRVLSMFRWIKNECVMHYDTQVYTFRSGTRSMFSHDIYSSSCHGIVEYGHVGITSHGRKRRAKMMKKAFVLI